MAMFTRELSDPTYTVVINGKTVGEVTRPVDRRALGRDKGTVYLARPVAKARGARRQARR
jgi:hypothetical protein